MYTRGISVASVYWVDVNSIFVLEYEQHWTDDVTAAFINVDEIHIHIVKTDKPLFPGQGNACLHVSDFYSLHQSCP